MQVKHSGDLEGHLHRGLLGICWKVCAAVDLHHTNGRGRIWLWHLLRSGDGTEGARLTRRLQGSETGGY